MNDISLVIDEAGAKGYSNNVETEPGELGVMVGYLIPSGIVTEIKKDLDSIRSRYFVDGKVHIVDLSSPQQQELRQSVYDFFVKYKIPWVYEAIYVQGYHIESESLNNLTKAAHAARKSNVRISWKAHQELLHAELFQGVFAAAVGYCTDLFGPKFKLSVITDRVDASILKLFRTKASEFVNPFQERTRNVTGFDATANKVVTATISTSITAPPGTLTDFSGVLVDVTCEDNSLTLAADVLANSVNHQLKNFRNQNKGHPLNTKKAIRGHPLISQIFGFDDDPECKHFADTIFPYPN